MPVNTSKFCKLGAGTNNGTGSIAAGSDETKLIQPPAGEIWQIINLRVNAGLPGGGSSGTHQFEIILDSGGQDMLTGRIKTAFNDYPNTAYTVFNGATTESPSSESAQSRLLCGNLWASHTHPIGIKYSNDTDVAQAGTRSIEYVYKVFQEL